MHDQFSQRLNILVDAALERQIPSREDLRWLMNAPDERTLEIVDAVSRVRFKFFERRVKLNFLLNIKSGLCPEDCNYCSQARDSEAPIQQYAMLSKSTFVDAAKRAREFGAVRMCMVASGRGPTEHELDDVADAVREVKANDEGMELCACLGLLKDGQAEKLAEAGVHAYNHNLNTSENYYNEICSTHTFADRQETVAKAKSGGLSPCSGALFGMGETDDDILDVGFQLKAMDPDSVPINFLIPIEGTPLSELRELTPQRCLRLLAAYRLLFPDVEVRIAGGREVHLRAMQPLGLYLANSIFIGDYLTTKGQAAEADLEMIADAGLVVQGADETTLPAKRVGEVRVKETVLGQ